MTTTNKKVYNYQWNHVINGITSFTYYYFIIK